MKKTVQNSMIVVSSINVLLLAGISLIWGLINSLELILYLPLINVSFPALIVLVYSVLIPISTVDIIPESVTLHIFNLSADLKNNNGNKLELLNKESTITILNLGSIFYFFLLLMSVDFWDKSSNTSFYDLILL